MNRTEDQLVRDHMSFVHKIAQKYRSCSRELEYEDLIAIGMAGLLHAIRIYDPERGIQFSTVAYHWIRGYILHELRSTRLIRIPTWRYERGLSGEDPVAISLELRESEEPICPRSETDDIDSAAWIADTLDKLSGRERVAVEMRYVHDASLKDISATIGTSVKWAHRIIHRGTDRLSRLLAE